MTKRVLDVGQCAPDHAAISRLLRSLGAEVVKTDGMIDTLDHLRSQKFALVLINRKLDFDYSDGMEILRAIKEDAELATIPVMLVSNFSEFQQQAIAAGAIAGFGKAELSRPETTETLRAVLGK
ncbi:MAG TPA: response regulator [Pirellulales bacterium]|jgi:CheY-like chemotaxis protein